MRLSLPPPDGWSTSTTATWLRSFDSGRSAETFYIAQEYICGCTLGELALAVEDRGRPLPIDLAVLTVVELARGLYHALRQTGPDGRLLQLWHGGLTPQRVMLSSQGEVKVVGYDREWLPSLNTRDVTITQYTAPELSSGRSGDPSADVYSVAHLLLAMLKIANSDDEPGTMLDEIRPGLADLVMSAASPTAADRPKDIGGLLRPLRAALHRLNPRCGPPELEDYLFGVLGDVLEHRIAQSKRLLKRRVTVEETVAKVPRAPTQTLLLRTDEKVQARAVDRVVGEDVPLSGVLQGTKYRILRPIGEGGMGTVYAAEHVDLEKVFALKILREKSEKERSSVVEGLRREARATSKLGHPNIVSVTDFGETPDGRVFFVMEYLEGQSLGELLEENKTMDQERLVEILIQVCEGLAAAHEKGVVHRDIKPDNIFLVPNRDSGKTVKLLDFGVAVPAGTARANGTHIAGTPYYMSPEMIRMKPLDGRADLYSLGVLAYEALCGKRPFGPAPVLQLLRMHLKEEPPPLSSLPEAREVHPELSDIVMRTLHKDPDQRFPDAQVMARELRALQEMLRELRNGDPTFRTLRLDSESIQHDIDETWTEALKRLDDDETLNGADRGTPAAGGDRPTALTPSPLRPLRIGLLLVGVLAVAAATVIVLSLLEWPQRPSERGAGEGSEPSVASTVGPVIVDSSIVDAAAKAVSVDVGPGIDASAVVSADAGGDAAGFDAGRESQTPQPPSRLARARFAVNSGHEALASGQLADAELHFRRALSLSWARPNALSGLGRVEFQRGNYTKAEHYARRALERNPSNARYRLQLGAALFRLGRRSDAEVLFRQVLVDNPSNRAAQRYLEAVQREHQ